MNFQDWSHAHKSCKEFSARSAEVLTSDDLETEDTRQAKMLQYEADICVEGIEAMGFLLGPVTTDYEGVWPQLNNAFGDPKAMRLETLEDYE